MGDRGPQPRHYKPLIDSGCIRLDTMTLWEGGGIGPRGKDIAWVNGEGKEIASVHVMQDDQFCITITYTTSYRGGPPERVDEIIELVSTPCQFGGQRVWFCCPGCGARARFLAAGERFRCRTCYPVSYPSQVMSRRENRRRKLYRLLELDPLRPFTMAVPPGRMRVERFRSLLAELAMIEGQMTQEVTAMADRYERTGQYVP